MTTRDSTPKFEVVHIASGTVALTHLSKTEATKQARQMSGARKGSFIARPTVRPAGLTLSQRQTP